MTDTSEPRLKWVVAFCITAAAVYGWSLGGGFLNWDDPTYVLHNEELRGKAGFGSILTTFHFANYNPLHRLSHWFEWQLAGDSATLYRVTNLLLHVGNAALVFAVLRAWLGRQGVAVVAAALFLVHPANVETVAWISQRKSLLATAFALGSTLCWLRERRGWSLALFFLGMLSKTSIAPLPVFLLALDLARRHDWRANVRWYAALLVPAIGLGAVQIMATSAWGASSPLHGGSVGSHTATVVAVLPYYAINLVLPFWPSPRHGFEPASFADPRFWSGVALLVAVGFGVVRSFSRERRFAAAAVWAAGALLVTLVVPIPILLADRYWYFAMPLLLGVAVDAASRAAPAHIPQLRATAGAVLIVFGAVAFDYARVFRDSTALWTHTLEREPGDVAAWLSLGEARLAVRDTAGAFRAYDHALALDPENPEAIENKANVELQQGYARDAQRRLEALLERDPGRYRARMMLAACHDLSGDTARAAQEFERLAADHGADREVRRAIDAFVARHPEHRAKLSGAAPGR